MYLCLTGLLSTRVSVAKFFQPSIDCIVHAVMEQKNSAHKEISVSSTVSPCISHSIYVLTGVRHSCWRFCGKRLPLRTGQVSFDETGSRVGTPRQPSVCLLSFST